MRQTQAAEAIRAYSNVSRIALQRFLVRVLLSKRDRV